MQRSVQDIKTHEAKIIAPFPNTYTFTKNLAEKFILKNLAHVRCVILRPAINACSVQQPFPGWTDTLSAAGAYSTLIGLGALTMLPGPGAVPLDLIPVDIVSNSIARKSVVLGKSGV